MRHIALCKLGCDGNVYRHTYSMETPLGLRVRVGSLLTKRFVKLRILLVLDGDLQYAASHRSSTVET